MNLIMYLATLDALRTGWSDVPFILSKMDAAYADHLKPVRGPGKVKLFFEMDSELDVVAASVVFRLALQADLAMYLEAHDMPGFPDLESMSGSIKPSTDDGWFYGQTDDGWFSDEDRHVV
jgi:hypothetical protein